MMNIESKKGYKVSFVAYKAERGTEVEHTAYEVSTEGLLRPSCSIWFENEEEMLFFADAINEFVEAAGLRKANDVADER